MRPHLGTHPKLGATSQEPMFSFEVRPGPAQTRFREIRWFEVVDSTNRYLIEEAATAPEGIVAVADYQTAGRGRLGRRWEAPPGSNLLVSVLLRPSIPTGEQHLLTVVAALAAAQASRQVAGTPVELKWPNDLQVSGRKLGGILAEAASGAVVVGLGLNVTWPEPDDAEILPMSELRAPATSLWRECGSRFSPAQLLDAYLTALEKRLQELSEPAGVSRQIAEYRTLCCTLGKTVTCDLADRTLEGTAKGVTDSGHLLLETGGSATGAGHDQHAGGTANGGTVVISAGDVVHVD